MEGLHAPVWNLAAFRSAAELTCVFDAKEKLIFSLFPCCESYLYSFFKTLGFYLDLYNKVVALFEYYFCLLFTDAVRLLSAAIFCLCDFIVWVCVCGVVVIDKVLVFFVCQRRV